MKISLFLLTKATTRIVVAAHTRAQAKEIWFEHMPVRPKHVNLIGVGKGHPRTICLQKEN